MSREKLDRAIRFLSHLLFGFGLLANTVGVLIIFYKAIVGGEVNFQSKSLMFILVAFIVTIMCGFLSGLTGYNDLRKLELGLFKMLVRFEGTIKSTPASTIVGLLAIQKSSQFFVTYVILSFALAAYIVGSYIFKLEINIGQILIIACLMLAINLNQKFLEYRISRGYYGTNEYEAREIISFILSYADKSNFTNDGTLIPMIPDPIIEDVNREDTPAGAEGAKA